MYMFIYIYTCTNVFLQNIHQYIRKYSCIYLHIHAPILSPSAGVVVSKLG